jgi:hypothetical protein
LANCDSRFIMRLKYLISDDCRQRYAIERDSVQNFDGQHQGSWYFQAYALVRLSQIAYAIGHPFAECRFWLHQATSAYRELFALRGTSFSKRVMYKDGKPLPEETISDDGYTAVDAFNAALASLAIQDIELSRELIELAGRSPNANLVSPRSEVCTTNELTLYHALIALLAADMDRANREANKLTVRRGTQIEKQIGLIISAIATRSDVVTEVGTLLYYHEKLALRRDHLSDTTYWFCLPALGLSQLAICLGQISHSDLQIDNAYFPVELLLASAEKTG